MHVISITHQEGAAFRDKVHCYFAELSPVEVFVAERPLFKWRYLLRTQLKCLSSRQVASFLVLFSVIMCVLVGGGGG